MAFEGPRHSVRLWDIVAGREIRRYPQAPLPKGRPFGFMIDHSLEFHLAFSPDGKLLAAEQTSESLCLWSVATGQLYRRFPGLEIGHGVAFTPDSERLITGGRHFRQWDIDRRNRSGAFPCKMS